MILGDSLWSNTSTCIPELVPRRVLELVGEFSRGKDSSSGLGRTGQTGRWTGLTGLTVAEGV